ncbi:MAG: hypothetical protein WD355_04095 [Balneolaceae bacterium]
MNSDESRHSQHILETGTATVTSGGHWFHATREKVDQFIPGLLKRQPYEKLIQDAVVWIESADSLALLLFFLLVFLAGTTVATVAALLFYFIWYFNKSAFVALILTPVLRLLNSDVIQIGVAALALSVLGMNGVYAGVGIGILFFFLFKVGLMRLFLGWLMSKRAGAGLPLNDRVLKIILVRYAYKEDLKTPQLDRLEEQIKAFMLKLKS